MNDIASPVKSAKVITYRKPQPPQIVNKCSFCGEPLVKGKFVQSKETAPAICFSCVGTCTELLAKSEA